MADEQPSTECGTDTPPVDHRPLSVAEIRKVRKIIEADERWAWFWSGTSKVGIWVAATITAINLSWDFIGSVVTEIVKQAVNK